MPQVHEAEYLAKEMFKKALVEMMVLARNGASQEELESHYDQKVDTPFGSYSAHLTSDWAEANLEQYLPNSLRDLITDEDEDDE